MFVRLHLPTRGSSACASVSAFCALRARSTRTTCRIARRVKHLTVLVRIVHIQLKAPVHSARSLDFVFHAPKARGRGGRQPRGTCRKIKRSGNGPPHDRVFGLPAALGGLRPHAGFHGAAAASPIYLRTATPLWGAGRRARIDRHRSVSGFDPPTCNLCTASSRHRLASPQPSIDRPHFPHPHPPVTLMCRATAGFFERRSMMKSWPLGLRAMASSIAWPRATSSVVARRTPRRSAASSWPRHM